MTDIFYLFVVFPLSLALFLFLAASIELGKLIEEEGISLKEALRIVLGSDIESVYASVSLPVALVLIALLVLLSI